jgi:hypothetical protein
MLSKCGQGWDGNTYNLNRTVDPGGIPKASSIMGGPKHLELSPCMSVDCTDQCDALSHKAEGIALE